MWIFDKLFNRKIEGKSSLDNLEPLANKVEVDEDGFIYITNGQKSMRFSILDDGFWFEQANEEGVFDKATFINPEDGIDKVSLGALDGLTHSFDELTPELKTIVDAAISAGSDGASCSYEQWADIKSLLDKTLYINYDGDLMIKTSRTGTSIYVFGGKDLADNYGSSLYLQYDNINNKLFGQFQEL